VSKPIENLYIERNNLAVALAKMVLAQGGKAGTGLHHNTTVLYIDVPGVGQVSYHLLGDDAALAADLPIYEGGWDKTFTGRERCWSLRVSS
jgi:hypothetical protein